VASIFTRIINGEIPCHLIGEDEDNFAFLDIFPLRPGHILVVPKQEVDYIFDLPEKQLVSLHVFSKKIAVAQIKAFPCKRIGTAVIGLEVPHAHIHLVPMNQTSDLDFTQPKLSISQSDLEEHAKAIRSHL
jgi:histidine triad (HIT) family protein